MTKIATGGFAYVGTYTTGKSEGIYLYLLQLSSGELRKVGVTTGVVNPSYLALERGRRYLYAVNEVTDFKGQKSGAVSAFAVDRSTGALRFLNQQPSLGGAPCYVTVADNGRFVLVANYVGGNVAVLPVRNDGSLGEAVDLQQHRGASGVNARTTAFWVAGRGAGRITESFESHEYRRTALIATARSECLHGDGDSSVYALTCRGWSCSPAA